ncbi:MAG: nucleoside triphosphate pyrophosphohydrolase [Rickettsiales bacterium]
MTKFYDVNRLGRDLMPEFFEKINVQYKIRTLDNDQEFEESLNAKVVEEVEEFFAAETEDEFLEEMADVVEVFRALLKLKGITWEEFEEIRKAKLEDRGGFEKRVFIDQLSEEDKRDSGVKLYQDQIERANQK